MPRGHVISDGRKVAALRGEADLTQWQLAKEAGYGLRTIGKIENGQPTGAGTLAAVATVLSRRLKRPVELGDLMQHTNGTAPLPCEKRLVEEAVKLLDLTRWQAVPPGSNGHAPENRVVLFDHYRFRELPPDLPVVTFQYGTMGKRIEGRCLTPATRSEWINLSGAPVPGEPPMRSTGQVRVRPEPSPRRNGWELQNRVEYVNAFLGPEREWFHTHIIYPTESMTMLLLFPEHKRAKAVQGVCKYRAEEPFEPTERQPIASPEGRFACWRIPSPQLGATYQLEWTW